MNSYCMVTGMKNDKEQGYEYKRDDGFAIIRNDKRR